MLPVELPLPSFPAEGQQLWQGQSSAAAALAPPEPPLGEERTHSQELEPPAASPAADLPCTRVRQGLLTDEMMFGVFGCLAGGVRDVECRGSSPCCEMGAGQAASSDPSAGSEPSLENHFSPLLSRTLARLPVGIN